ncbi:MAG TPA: hypothetical protein VFB13_08025 [Reyranella sp.]|jgi:hypothetical protein|nr:hypothetical protein [Reyranella sp.]
MSHSVPSDSSVADRLVLVGADLVTFDRRDVPIYATPASLWADAGKDAPLFGAPIDRLFGDPGDIFVATVPLAEEPRDLGLPADDSLVVISSIGDGFTLPMCEHQPGYDLPLHAAHRPDVATVYDFSGDSHFLLPVHAGSAWDLARPEWFYDHHI